MVIQSTTMLPARGAVVVMMALALSLASGSAAASPGGDRVLAKQHFESGASHFDLSEYDEALVEFKEAYRLKADATFLYNIAQCHRKLGHLEEALTFYKTYLRRSPDAPNREEVERRIQELDVEQRAKQSRKAEEEKTAKPAETVAIPPSPPAEAPEQQPVAAPVPEPVPVPLPVPVPAALEVPALPVAVNSAPPNRVELAETTSSKPHGEATAETSILHRWWFWSGIGAVVVTGVVVGIVAARGGGGGIFCSDCANTSGVNLP